MTLFPLPINLSETGSEAYLVCQMIPEILKQPTDRHKTSEMTLQFFKNHTKRAKTRTLLLVCFFFCSYSDGLHGAFRPLGPFNLFIRAPATKSQSIIL